MFLHNLHISVKYFLALGVILEQNLLEMFLQDIIMIPACLVQAKTWT